MSKRRQMHLFIILGVSCALVPILLDGLELVDVPAWLRSVMVPLGGGLAGSAVGGLKHQKRLTRDRDYQKRQKELHDERNTMIRCKAGVISGNISLTAMILVVMVVHAMGLIPSWLFYLLGILYIVHFFLWEMVYRWLQRKM